MEVLIVDDSIVRGTTSRQIVQMAREAGAKKVYFASAAPPVRFPNVYGIDMPSANELIAYGRDEQQVCSYIGADELVYQDLDDLIKAVQKKDKTGITRFDTSVFNGEYITGDVTDGYLANLHACRNDGARNQQGTDKANLLDLHNQG